MNAPDRKRSLTPTLTPEEQPLKQSRSDSFHEPDPIAQDVHAAVLKVFQQVLEIFTAVKSIPVAKWSSLGDHAAERMQFSQNVFARVIQNRYPGYNFQIPDLESRKEKEAASSNSSQGSADLASPEKSTPEIQKEKLVRRINKLYLYLLDCRKELGQQELDKAAQKAKTYDNLVYQHYGKKVPELGELKPPRFSPDFDLLVACPRRPCSQIDKIETIPLSKRPDIQSSLKEYLELAQRIHDHFQVAVVPLEPCQQRIEDWSRLQIILRKQLLDAKEKRLYRDEAHAMQHLEKMEQRCRKQHEQSLAVKKHAWEKAATYGEPPLYCSPMTLCDLPFVMHALQGSRTEKLKIEDMVLAVAMEITIQSQKMTLPLFAIMDGHGGDQTAQFCKENLATIFATQIVKYNSEGISRHGLMNAAKVTCLTLQKDAPEISGTTLLFATVVNGLLYVFSVGDSRAWLLGNGMRALTFDASPAEPECQEKVHLRGGTIIEDKFGTQRVAGTLNLSLMASIGDKLDACFLVHVPKTRSFRFRLFQRHPPAISSSLLTDFLQWPQMGSCRPLSMSYKHKGFRWKPSPPIFSIARWRPGRQKTKKGATR
ncbi:MAG: protein phosphatase 2C family protein [Parachlamydia sp.]|nr:protein phosphatase 2C family protein [Parachlamydia sp.]